MYINYTKYKQHLGKGKNMWNFLAFNHFITQDVLIFFYYIGVFMLPIVLIFSRKFLVQYISLFKKIDDKMRNSSSLKEKITVLISFFVFFMFVELGWRMLFEMIIGYFDMHDYLYKISHSL